MPRKLTPAIVLVLGLLAVLAAPASAQSSDVRVVNPPEDAANVAPIASTLPFLRNALAFVPSGSNRTEVQIAPLIPAGFRGIVTNMTAYVQTDPSQRASVLCRIPALGIGQPDFLFPIPIAPQMTQFNASGVAVWEVHSGSTAVAIPVEPTTTFFCEVRRSRNVDSAAGNISLMGHLVPADGGTRAP
jgi:hypothetical protein